MQFSDAYNALLDFAARPETNLVARAQSEINAACLWANRNHDFKFAEYLETQTFPANSGLIPISSLLTQGCINLISAQVVQAGLTPTPTTGLPLKIMQYQKLQDLKLTEHNLTPLFNSEFSGDIPPSDWLVRFEQWLQRDYKYYIVVMGQSFQLYPNNCTPQTVIFQYNQQLPTLVSDSDTNFLLQYCWDYILMRALKRFNIYLKDDQRINITNEELQAEWKSILEWDGKLRTTQY